MLTVLLILVLLGVGLWLVNTMIPMDPKIKTIMNVVVVIAVILWLLDIFGFLPSGGLGAAPRYWR